MSALWRWMLSLLSAWATWSETGTFGQLECSEISTRKATQRQGIGILAQHWNVGWGPGRFPAVLTLVARQSQAPKAKVRSLVWCLHQYLQMYLLPIHHGGWWAVVKAFSWSWKLNPRAGFSLKAQRLAVCPNQWWFRISNQSPKQQRVHISGFELKF